MVTLGSRYQKISSPIPAVNFGYVGGDTHGCDDLKFSSGIESKTSPRLRRSVNIHNSEEREYHRMLFKFSPIKNKMILSKKKIKDACLQRRPKSHTQPPQQPQPLLSLLNKIPLTRKRKITCPIAGEATSSLDILRKESNDFAKESTQHQHQGDRSGGGGDHAIEEILAFEWPTKISPPAYFGKENVDGNTSDVIFQLEGGENISPCPLSYRHQRISRVQLQPRRVGGLPRDSVDEESLNNSKRCRDNIDESDNRQKKLYCSLPQPSDPDSLDDYNDQLIINTKILPSTDARSITSNVVTDSSSNSSLSSSPFWDQNGSGSSSDLSDNFFASAGEDGKKVNTEGEEKPFLQPMRNGNSYSPDYRFVPPMDRKIGFNIRTSSKAADSQSSCAQSQGPPQQLKLEHVVPQRSTSNSFCNKSIYPKNSFLKSEFKRCFEDLQNYVHRYPNDEHFTKNPRLSIWVKHLRDHFKLFSEGKKIPYTVTNCSPSIPKIDNTLIAQINEAVLPHKFSWRVEKSKNKGQHTWNLKYEELRKYKAEHGDCLAPTKYKKNPALGRWVSTQRADYKLYQAGNSSSSMTPERVELLEELGFVWRLQF